MNAAQMGMATTEHNIVNASTPGFTRQQMVVGQRIGQQTGTGFVGQGVEVSGVKRIYDQFLTAQVRLEQSQASYFNTYTTEIQQVNNLLADSSAGATTAMQGFFDAANTVANSPESVAARQSMLSSAQFVVNRFQAIDQRLTDMASSLNGQISTSVKSVNSSAVQIALLNGAIKRATINGQGQLPNDLLDQRDQLLSQLNKEIKTTVQEQSDGTVNVYVGTGQPLVFDERAMQLQTVQSSSEPGKLDISYSNNGSFSAIQQSSLQGGNIGAYLTFRDQNLEPARNALGRVAMGLADNLNRQNQLGQDLNGAMGGNLYAVAAPRVDRNAANNPASGIPSVTINSVSGLMASDYQLKFDGAAYTLTRLSDNAATKYASLPQSVEGMTITAPQPVTAGDSFIIRPVANGARDLALLTNDYARIAAAAPILGSAAATNSGTAQIGSGSVNAPPPVNASLKNNVTVSFIDATHFSVTDNTAGTVLAASTLYDPNAGATLNYNGWTTQITGTAQANDSFVVAANTNSTGDNRNALLMASMQTQNLMANGTASFQGLYGQLVSDVSTKTHELIITSKAQDSMLAQTVSSQQAVSGVNLDEEAANLIRFQKAYQAAAKAMQIAQTMFDALMAIR